jgi:hypothetical protein
MDCEKIRPLLSRFIDDQLDEAQRAEIEKHLAACKDCSEYYENLLGLQKAAEGIEMGGDDAYWMGQKNAVMERIEEAEAARVTPVRPKPRFTNAQKLVAVAASILLISLVSIFESQDYRPSWGLFKRKAAPSRTIQPEVEEPSRFYATMEADTARQKKDVVAADRERREIPEEKVPQEKPVAEREKGAPSPDEFEPAVEVEDVGAKKHEPVPTEEITPEEEEPPEAETVVSPRPEKSEKATEVKPRGVEADELQRVPEKVVVKEETMDLTPGPESPEVSRLVQKSAGLDKTAATGTAAEAEGVMGLTAFADKKAVMFDNELFGDFTEEQKSEYIEWRRKVDILQSKYGFLTSVHGEEIYAKARQPLPEDSLQIVIMEMAVASYRLGKITPIEDELRAMLENLRSLSVRADSSGTAEIQRYIGDLELLLK